jgi:hypothetical protein
MKCGMGIIIDLACVDDKNGTLIFKMLMIYYDLIDGVRFLF